MNSAVRNITRDIEVSPSDFRGAMRRLTGGVSVITVGRGSDITGMTVTSVSSLAVEPPTLIVSVNRESSSWPLLKRNGFFGVNILAANQIEVAERFTGKGGLKGADRFAGAQWTTRGLRRAASGRRVVGDRLPGGRDRRAAFPCHRDRPRAGHPDLPAHGGIGLLARAIYRGRAPGRRDRARVSGSVDSPARDIIPLPGL